jgi:hypothetical protein
MGPARDDLPQEEASLGTQDRLWPSQGWTAFAVSNRSDVPAPMALPARSRAGSAVIVSTSLSRAISWS